LLVALPGNAQLALSTESADQAPDYVKLECKTEDWLLQNGLGEQKDAINIGVQNIKTKE